MIGVERVRETGETRVRVSLLLTPSTETSVRTGVRMLDHLLEQFAFHARASLRVEAASLDAIAHHLIEDVAIVFAQTIREALEQRRCITRFGEATIVMDDALVRCAIDAGGRSYARVNLALTRERVEDLSTDMVPHFFSTLASNANIALHIDRLAGNDEHHVVEAAFKGFARALRVAWTPDESVLIPSTKGVL